MPLSSDPLPKTERPDRSSRRHYRRFVEDYKRRRLDAVAEEKEKAARALTAHPGTVSAADAQTAAAPQLPWRRQSARAYLQRLWPYRFAVAAVFVLTLITAGLDMIEPLFMRFIIDRVLLNTALDGSAR